jgi:hypothetical protein
VAITVCVFIGLALVLAPGITGLAVRRRLHESRGHITTRGELAALAHDVRPVLAQATPRPVRYVRSELVSIERNKVPR